MSKSTTARKARLSSRRIIVMICIVALGACLLTISFLAGVVWAKSLKPDQLDTDLSDYVFRLKLLRNIMFVTAVASLVWIAFNTRAIWKNFQTPRPINPYRTEWTPYILQSTCMIAFGVSLGYIIMATDLLSSH